MGREVGWKSITNNTVEELCSSQAPAFQPICRQGKILFYLYLQNCSVKLKPGLEIPNSVLSVFRFDQGPTKVKSE